MFLLIIDSVCVYFRKLRRYKEVYNIKLIKYNILICKFLGFYEWIYILK